jgi:hypothetical protein
MDATRVCLKFGRASSCALRKSRIAHLICCAGYVFLGIDSTRPFYFALQQLFVLVRLNER